MKQALTLYELNELVSETLQTVMPDEYWVEAELSEVREVRGHCYVELVQKDEQTNTPIAKASAKCWKNKWMLMRPYFERMTGQSLGAGMKVLLKVYANFHEAYGFSWIITDIDPVYTMGDMARKRQEIIAQLKAEGVFDLQKELTLPLFAQRVAVVSSEQAAGYGDFLRQLQDNDAGLSFDVQLFPAVMQGEKVEQSVINALNQINDQVDKFDVVVIIRGGGATSDLSGFDTILLAENVANFPLPIITGIGHDRDESVLDMISFQRVKTPTAAAAYLVEHLRNTWHRIDDAEQEIIQTVRHAMELEKNRFDLLTSKIPFLFSHVKHQQLTHLQQCQQRLTTSARLHVHQAQQHIEVHSARLSPTVQRLLLDTRHHLDLLEQRCSLLDPQLLLKRGYSITLRQGRAVRNAHQLKAGDEIETRVEKGIIKSTVK
ncbi:exodeoxyribonuclease VII large subunit [Hoylesella timonensis]|uniref:exodeoxyribonuclease VII large subunit n=1 Tax=Hoylesella timonensis TaxID=386414 RepID=UPI003369ED3A